MPSRFVGAEPPRQIVSSGHGAERGPANRSTRAATAVPHDPYRLGLHGEALLERRLMLAPVLVTWRYRIRDASAFRGWLATKEILLSQARMAREPAVAGIHYGGTYRAGAELNQPGGTYATLWGYRSEAAMLRMQELGSGKAAETSLIELELVDFLTGLKRQIAEAGDEHFSQEVLIAAEVASV